MPYGLFDYTPDSTIHTMGLSPRASTGGGGGGLPDWGGQMKSDLISLNNDQFAQKYGGANSVKTGSTLTSGGGSWTNPDTGVQMVTRAIPEDGGGGGNPYTLRMPEDPTQQVTTAALYEEGNVPPTTKPPGGGGGGGSCPPGYSPSPSPAPAPVFPAPVPNPRPPGNITTDAALCAENPAFCKIPYTGITELTPPGAPYTPPGGYGAYNPYTRGTTGSEDVRNYPEIQAQRNAEMMAAAQKAQELGRPGMGLYTAPGGAVSVEEAMMGGGTSPRGFQDLIQKNDRSSPANERPTAAERQPWYTSLYRPGW